MPSAPPKEESSRTKKFKAQHGGGQLTYELDALDPADLQTIVRQTINRVLNMSAVGRERKQWKVDQDAIDKRREQILAVPKNQDDKSGGNE